MDPFAVKEASSPFTKSDEVVAKQKRDGSRPNKKEMIVSARNSVMAELANNLKRSSSNTSA